MTLLQKELSSLEIEPLEVLVAPPVSGQEKSLDTLTAMKPGEVESDALLTDTLPANSECCCCCCCPAPCCGCG